MFKGLIFGVMLSSFVLSSDGHLSLSGDVVPITKPDDGNYFETEVTVEYESEEETEPEAQPDPENGEEGGLEVKVSLEGLDSESSLDESRYMEMLEAVRSLSRNELESVSEIETETEFDPEVAVFALSESGVTGVPQVGVVLYKGTFNGQQGYLMLPYDRADQLDYDETGLLINVGSSSVTGRFFTGDSLDLSDYHAQLYILDSVYTSPNNLYKYGSYGVMRSYSQSGSSLTYTSTYGNFYVQEEYIYEPQNDLHKIFLLVAGLFIAVVGIILFRRKGD